MNAKYGRLKKALIASGIKALLMVAGCGIAFGAASYFHSNAQDDLRKLQSQDRQLKTKINRLRERNERAGNTLELYEQLTKDSNLRSLELNRRNISNLLNRLSEKYRIDNISINIRPLEEQTKEPFVKKTGTIITTQISLDFDGPSDAHVFAFSEELFKSFSGYLNFKAYTINRAGEVSEGLLRELLTRGKTNFIRGSVSFDWLGLRPKPENEEEGQAS